jgi:hypothetical protein
LRSHHLLHLGQHLFLLRFDVHRLEQLVYLGVFARLVGEGERGQ